MKLLFKRLSVVLLTVVATACGSKYTYESVENDPLNARIYTLGNGLKVYMTVNKETPRIQTYIAVRVGGKNDPHETTGLAHYFEHLMFKGTQQFGTQNYELEEPMLDQIEALFEVYRKTADEAERKAIYRQIDSISYEASKIAIPNEYDKLMAAIGSEGSNAYTGYDMTVYIEDIPSNEVENWARIQADRFQNAVIRGFHTELETVYEEKNISLTQDSRKVYETLMAGLFTHHPYGTQTVLGTQHDLKNPSITNIKNYYHTWYVPNNMAICLSGDFDPDKMIAIIDQYFGHLEPNPALPQLTFEAESTITAPIVKEVLGPDAESVTLAWRLDGAASRDGDLAQLAGSILNNGQAGLFDLNLNQQQKVLNAEAYPYMNADYGSFILEGRPKAGQNLDEVKDLLLSEVSKLASGEFDESLLEASINNFKASMMKYTDTNSGRADLFVQSFIYGQPWKEVVETVDRISKITKEEIMTFAKEKLGPENYVIVYKRQGQDPNETKIEKPEITPIFANRDTASQFLRDIQTTRVKPIDPVFVDYEKDMSQLTAKSQIPVLYTQNKTNGLFSLTYVYDFGRNQNPLLGMAADYIDYLGTDQKSAEEIKRELYDIACSFRIVSQENRTYIALEGLSENMSKAMEIVEDLLAHAQPDDAILANLKADMLKARADSKLNQRANLTALQRYTFFGEQYVKGTSLRDSEIEIFNSDQLLTGIRKLRDRQHTILYYGPESETAIIDHINQYHYAPETLKPAGGRQSPYLTTPENRVLLAQYDAQKIDIVQYSNRNEPFDVKNDAAVALFNEYFGGGMTSLVFQELRERRGLAYTARAFLMEPSYLTDPYFFTTYIGTQNDKLGLALDAFDEIIERMPQSQAAFDIAKESLLKRIRTQRTIKDDILWSFLDNKDLGLTQDRNKAIYEQVEKMTLDDLKTFHQQWIKDRKYTYSILGDIKELDMNKLESLGPVTILTREQIFGY